MPTNFRISEITKSIDGVALAHVAISCDQTYACISVRGDVDEAMDQAIVICKRLNEYYEASTPMKAKGFTHESQTGI